MLYCKKKKEGVCMLTGGEQVNYRRLKTNTFFPNLVITINQNSGPHSPTNLKKFLFKIHLHIFFTNILTFIKVFLFGICSWVIRESMHTPENTYPQLSADTCAK